MNIFLFGVACLFGIATIGLKILHKQPKISIATKFLTTFSIFLAVLTYLKLNQLSELSILMIAFGLCAGAIGDLLLEWEKSFIPGMFSFFLGHIFYIFGFYSMGAKPSWSFLLAMLTLGFVYFTFIRKSLGKQKIPVLGYVIVISLMVVFSASTDSSAFPGAVLFFISDMFLSYDKYVKKIPNRDFIILSTYFTEQFLIAFSVI